MSKTFSQSNYMSPSVTNPTPHNLYSLTMNMMGVLLVHFLFVSSIFAATASSITTDQQALLALKAHIIDDPTNFLAKNWSKSSSVCNWMGVTCDANQHSRRVTTLNISGLSLTGTIPFQLGNLSSLQTLDLSRNRLSGEIPQELGNLAELKLVSLANNFLIGTIPSTIFNLSSLSTGMDFSSNSLNGSFPDDMCQRLHLLKRLYMSRNQFTGHIPRNLWQCKELIHISLSFNQFTGSVPADIGNLTSLKILYIGYNNLTGEIPYELGSLRNLEILGLSQNNLFGVVPATIFNMSTVKEYDLFNNTLSGSLPSSADFANPNLERLLLALNNFSGTIPSFIWNASKLSVLELGRNSFSGFIPNMFINMRNLERLHLSDNCLTSSTPELSFLSSLTNCKNLRVIALSKNPLNGVLPSSIGNLSLSCEEIYFHNSNIQGSIPKEIGNLINLTTLRLGYNKLIGSIPMSLGRLQKLQGLALENNKLEGKIPNDLCHLARLSELYLHDNSLSGSIPQCLGNLTSLRKLTLNSNELTSVIPSTFWNLKDILGFNFSSNSLNGSLPQDIRNLKVVVTIDLSRNNLYGDIPTEIGELKNLQYLSLAYNKLQGSIPKSFGDLVSLEFLNLSNNNLSGNIPISMTKLAYLKDLNLSFNRLEGEIPIGGSFANFSSKSFLGNELLCGSPHLQVRLCKTSSRRKSIKNVILLGVVLPLSTVFIISVLLALRFGLIFRCRQRNTELSNIQANMSPQLTWRRFSYQELLQATDQFSEKTLIGIGSFGSVYKGRFLDGMEVAIKVFHLQIEGSLKSFDVECEVLKSIRHRNLVKVISSCSNVDFKALVLVYMPHGSLEDCLYCNSFNLDIFQRLSVMIDVASALEYLHFGLPNPMIHCDIKPSNVLLDKDMVAHLSDFGIARLLNEEESMKQTQTLATIGYMAPEYGREGQVSTKGDVYSYGIMLMEIFTRKKPTNEMFIGERSIRQWVYDSLPISIMNVVDTNLLRNEDKHFDKWEQCVSSVLSLALECTRESPTGRINSKEIVTRLVNIRDALIANTEMVLG